MTDVKICGINEPESMTAAIEGGARFVGLVFYPKSPRYVDIEVAGYLGRYVPTGVRSVGLFVNPTDEELERTVSGVQLDIIQLHGSESPGRIAEIKQKFGLQVIKSMPIANKEDLESVPGFEVAADYLMFDARPAPEDELPGGNGLPFDWTILEGFSSSRPWFLAGGLTAENVKEAIDLLGPDIVDVSSGVEDEPGVKSINKIKAFLEAVKQA
ncbi:MAG: phosphoribosylanthranilate isomerase [Pseudomonadota bacterium]